MSGNIQIRVTSGRKKYTLNIQNLDMESDSNDIEIILPNYDNQDQLDQSDQSDQYDTDHQDHPDRVERSELERSNIVDTPVHVNGETNNFVQSSETLHDNEFTAELKEFNNMLDESKEHNCLLFGNPNRPEILFDELVSTNPGINNIRQTKMTSLNFYKEIVNNFDKWIRFWMKTTVAETAIFASYLDKVFGVYLLKFTRAISNRSFLKVIHLMEQPLPDETLLQKDKRERLKTVLLALKDGILNEIITLFDSPNCSCYRCML